MKTPKLLFYGIKRILFDSVKQERKRICWSTEPPLLLTYELEDVEWNTSHYSNVVKEETYNLFALVMHGQDGNETDCGHYFIVVMDWFSGKWFKCNDEHIEPIKFPLDDSEKEI